MPHNGECVFGWNFAIMTAEPAIFALPEAIKIEECHTLDQFIRSAADRAVVLDGQRVKKFSGLAAQLIAAHQSVRQGTDAKVSLILPSQALTDALAALDLTCLLDGDRGAT